MMKSWSKRRREGGNIGWAERRENGEGEKETGQPSNRWGRVNLGIKDNREERDVKVCFFGEI